MPANIKRRLQQYIKTDISYLTSSGFWVFLSYAIKVLVGLLTMVALANLLPKESLGVYQYVLAVASIVGLCTLTGLGQPVVRAVAQGKDGVFLNAVRVMLRWSSFIVLAAGLVAIYYFIQGDTRLGISFLIVGACVPLIGAFSLYQAYLIGKEAFRDMVLLGAWRKPLPLIAIVATLMVTDSVVALVAAYFVSHTLSAFLVFYKVLRKYRPRGAADRDTIVYAKHMSVMRILTKGSTYADKIILWHFLGPVAVATFSVAQFASRYSGDMVGSLNNLVLPRLAKRDLSTLQATLPRKVWLASSLMVLFTGLYVLVVPPIFNLLFPQYTDASAYAQMLGMAFLVIPFNAYAQSLVAHRQVRFQYVNSILIPATRVGLLLLLIPLFNTWGAVYATILTSFVSALLGYTFFNLARHTSDAPPAAQR
jgi:O-antigen/teichoic acid export membrane protein